MNEWTYVIFVHLIKNCNALVGKSKKNFYGPLPASLFIFLVTVKSK